jgi:hypothetical protein
MKVFSWLEQTNLIHQVCSKELCVEQLCHEGPLLLHKILRNGTPFVIQRTIRDLDLLFNWALYLLLDFFEETASN